MNAFSKTVHPHGRGDNRIAVRLRAEEFGSPPRAWGQSPHQSSISSIRRFTPTGVGTMNTSKASLARATVHPHGRGDNFPLLFTARLRRSSPPRAWGQYQASSVPANAARFTPTGVGTMPPPTTGFCPFPVHPHGRGDNAPSPRKNTSSNGSPPRAWGQWTHRIVGEIAGRFTPTGVGTIATASASAMWTTVHPHGRGDNTRQGYETTAEVGSPPRAWGQCDEYRWYASMTRFTPTGVGTIRHQTCSRRDSAVHPHGRGDNAQAGGWFIGLYGSPPRAWGQ